MIPTYIAYRLPNDNVTHYQMGNGNWIQDTKMCESSGILLHSFLGDRILYINKTVQVEPGNFQTFFTSETAVAQTKEDYQRNFRRLKEEMKAGNFKKVILSRTKKINTKKTALSIFDGLNKNYKNTFNYIISNAEIGTWIGATPERLLTAESTSIKTMSLAGTKTNEDEWTAKEIDEQQLVTDTILNALHNNNCTAIKTDGPNTLKAGKVEHLHTTIQAKLSNSNDWKTLLNALHPTPAVCGIPTTAAKTFIPKLETHSRNFYTGYIGLLSEEKKQFFVNLRCMEYYGNAAKLYLGGGITLPSEEEAEWRETERKSQTLVDIIT